ncbi:hypothetical protein [Spirosoma rhododendri]|uniref:Uncharacterized protein n=1 Tax=Spirosoma rhododendri TaxID=2728024 RepID=A0A7L5DSV7_9BACT|nr:hypothetical protein [Spirosoma rhododendri]QJD80692.1 hypothetical protein HH216_21420 [Spirosoma rhododendri]
MKGLGDEVLDVEEITTQAQKLLEKGKDELLKSIGNATPSNVVTSILQIDSFSKNQLSSAEKLKLPSPTEQIQDDKVGETIFSSFKRTIYKSLCDPESDIYKAWFTNGVNSLLSKKYITGAVVSTLAGLGVGIKMIAASITALILKFGIEVYCAHKKPKGVMEMR